MKYLMKDALWKRGRLWKVGAALVFLVLVWTVVPAASAHATGSPPQCNADQVCGGSDATPWQLSFWACDNAALDAETNNEHDLFYPDPEAIAQVAVKVYQGTLSSISYTDFFRNQDGTVIPTYEIYLTNSTCQNPNGNDPNQPYLVMDATYGGLSPYGQVCSDYSYVPAGQSCDGTKKPQNPCPPSDVSECLLAANAAYGLDINALNIPPEMQEIDRSVIPRDGYAAIAFEDSHNNVLIANEGAHIASPLGRATPYQNNSFLAYTHILRGVAPRALADAVAFAQKVQQDAQQRSDLNGKIYVTGHDLGGVEAEAQMQAIPSLAGGVTFGATGLPGNAALSGPSTFTNYVDYGDTVGYWASDPDGPLQLLAPANMNHFGSVQEVGNSYSATLVLFAANLDKELKAVNDALNPLLYLEDTFGNKQPVIKTAARLVTWTGLSKVQVNKRVTGALTVAEYSSLATALLLYHALGHYAADFHVDLTPTVAPAMTMEQFLKLYDPGATASEIKDAQATTVNSNGTLKSPDLTISFDAQTGDITDETYIATNNTTYDATFDAKELVSSILVNEDGGGSYRLYNDDFNTHPWSSSATFYDGTNGAGTVIETLYNWHTGGSQVQLFTHLPRGVTEEIRNYSGPDGTGTLLSVQRF